MPQDHDRRSWENSGRYPLSRGHTRIRAITDLANGLTVQQMAEKYEVSEVSVSMFKRRFKKDITDLKKAVVDEVVDLWIADKTNRMYEYQQAAEDLEAAVANVLERGGFIDRDSIGLLQEKRKIFRAVAEELGQLPPRNAVEVHGATVTYNFEGINPDDVT